MGAALVFHLQQAIGSITAGIFFRHCFTSTRAGEEIPDEGSTGRKPTSRSDWAGGLKLLIGCHRIHIEKKSGHQQVDGKQLKFW